MTEARRPDPTITFQDLRARLRASGIEHQIDEISYASWLSKLQSTGDRLVVAMNERSDEVHPFLFSALMEGGQEEQERILSFSEWDIDQDIGRPGIVTYTGYGPEKQWGYDDGRWELSRASEVYFRPLVYSRWFHDARKPQFQLIEEFELFLEATWNQDELEWFDDAGDRHIAARRFNSPDRRGIEVTAHEMKDFLAATGLSLVRFSDLHKRLSIAPEAVLGKDSRLRVRQMNERSRIDLLLTSDSVLGRGDKLYVSLWTKEIIPGYARPTPRRLGERAEDYEEFAIGRNEEGEEILLPCSPDSPHYLTPIMFRPDVLSRYQQEPSKYEFRHQQIVCQGLWSLNYDDISGDRIGVFLGDLGLIPKKEQRHWRSYNLPERGRLSEARYKTAVLAEWPTESTPNPPYDFREALSRASGAGGRLLGKPLFRPLDKADEHVSAGLHVPATNEAKEFDLQVGAMAKMLADSINNPAIKEHSGLAFNGTTIKGSLDLLKAWLTHLGADSASIDQAIKPLRVLQQLRSQGAAHRRGSDYQLLLKKNGLDTLTTSERVRRVMTATTRGLCDLADLLDAI